MIVVLNMLWIEKTILGNVVTPSSERDIIYDDSNRGIEDDLIIAREDEGHRISHQQDL